MIGDGKKGTVGRPRGSTGKARGNVKKTMSFTLDESLYHEFKEVAESRGFQRSAVLSIMIRNWINFHDPKLVDVVKKE